VQKKTENMPLQNQSNKVRQLYNRLALLYNFLHWLGMPRPARLASQIKVLPAGKLLEVGVGTGGLLPFFKGQQVTGIDLSEKMLARASRQNHSNVTLYQMDGIQLAFSAAAFDTVVMAHVLSVAPDPDAVLAEVFRVLKPGGKLLIQNYFTPETGIAGPLRFFQKAVAPFHIRLIFRLGDLQVLKTFQLLREERFGLFGMFRLLVFQKPQNA
jgi:phosphatidylethanolamine/phosphatidyl-N-methylethanolamine N-methyltransferase